MTSCCPSQFYSVPGASSFIFSCCQHFLQGSFSLKGRTEFKSMNCLKAGIAVMIRVSMSLPEISKCILQHTCTYTVNVTPLGRAILKGTADLGSVVRLQQDLLGLCGLHRSSAQRPCSLLHVCSMNCQKRRPKSFISKF